MKTALTSLVFLFITLGLLAETPKPQQVEIWGTVAKVLEHGVIVDAAFEEGGSREPWRGYVFLVGHPKFKTVAEGDKVEGFISERIGNYREKGSETVLRAYKFLRRY